MEAHRRTLVSDLPTYGRRLLPGQAQELAMNNELSQIDDALQALRQGRIVIVVDDQDRENEGDFVAAADKVTPEMIEFMITNGRGQVCMPILPEVAARLHLPPYGRPEHGAASDALHDTGRPSILPHGHKCRGAGSDSAGHR